ncbi:MAG: hypothetical protein ACLGPL_01745 [Acidobacteriota bacterium]
MSRAFYLDAGFPSSFGFVSAMEVAFPPPGAFPEGGNPARSVVSRGFLVGMVRFSGINLP